MVVQTGASQPLIVKRETQRFNQVQFCPGVRTQPDDITRVWWDFWFEQSDVQQISSCT
jgi:hypothetical protein